MQRLLALRLCSIVQGINQDQSSDTPNKAWSCESRTSQESNCTRNFKSACDCYDSGAERRSAWAISQVTPHVTTLLRIAALPCCSVLLLCSALLRSALLCSTAVLCSAAELCCWTLFPAAVPCSLALCPALLLFPALCRVLCCVLLSFIRSPLFFFALVSSPLLSAVAPCSAAKTCSLPLLYYALFLSSPLLPSVWLFSASLFLSAVHCSPLLPSLLLSLFFCLAFLRFFCPLPCVTFLRFALLCSSLLSASLLWSALLCCCFAVSSFFPLQWTISWFTLLASTHEHLHPC